MKTNSPSKRESSLDSNLEQISRIRRSHRESINNMSERKAFFKNRISKWLHRKFEKTSDEISPRAPNSQSPEIRSQSLFNRKRVAPDQSGFNWSKPRGSRLTPFVENSLTNNQKNRFNNTANEIVQGEGPVVSKGSEARSRRSPAKSKRALVANLDTLKNIQFVGSPAQRDENGPNWEMDSIESGFETDRCGLRESGGLLFKEEDPEYELRTDPKIQFHKTHLSNPNPRQNKSPRSKHFRSFAHSSRTEWTGLDALSKTISVRNTQGPESQLPSTQYPFVRSPKSINNFQKYAKFQGNTKDAEFLEKPGVNVDIESNQVHANKGTRQTNHMNHLKPNSKQISSHQNHTENNWDIQPFQIKRMQLISDLSVDRMLADCPDPDQLGTGLGPSHCIIPGMPYKMENEADPPTLPLRKGVKTGVRADSCRSNQS